ncbi:TPA: erm Leader peptide [Staphylococcus aureus]|nr:erm Leader peptide [Staphylococcus aureus]
MTYGSIIAIACALFVIFFIPYMEKNNIKKK